MKTEFACVRAEGEIVRRRGRRAGVAIIDRARNAAHLRVDQGQPRGRPGPGADTDAPATAAPADVEALRQALPQLVRLERYARRAFLRGDRTARRLAAIACNEPETFDHEAELG